ncbi:MAG: alcohol dehydrogenase catalytic domain-containing protein [Aestuariibacter sp.]|nr:alcohol dehydrogenase catalytic domain-containing protein [Aestuariibacter sp.]
MLSMMLKRPNKYEILDVPIPAPGEGQALIKVTQAGICATDLATIAGNNPMTIYPLIPGHECVGEVVSAPTNSGYKPGERVTIFPSVGCGKCLACNNGLTNHCPTFKVQGINLPGGCFAQYMVSNVDQLIRLSDKVYERFGPLIEPLAVGTHANRRGGTSKGSSVLVIGAGATGLASALSARASGAARVLLVDRFESRRQKVLQLGFADFSTLSGDALISWVEKSVGSVDIVLDNVTNGQTVGIAAQVLRPGGRCVLIGLPHGDHGLMLPFSLGYKKELSFVFSRNYVKNDFFETIELLEMDAYDPAPMITAIYPLTRIAEALKSLQDNPEKHVKVLVDLEVQQTASTSDMILSG